MSKVSRRTFSGVLLSASALTAQDGPKTSDPAPLELPPWRSAPAGGDAFALPGPPSPRTRWNVPGPPRKYFTEWLPALFERTIELEQPGLRWIFTGPHGGFTVETSAGKVRLAVRYYDSPGLSKVPPVAPTPARHPEGIFDESSASFRGDLKAVTIVVDHRLTLRVLLNGKEALSSRNVPDVNRHQISADADQAPLRGRLLPPAVQSATVTVEEGNRFQEILGWGGTTTPPAYAELSPEGRREWWRAITEYNLLLHREYPTGARLNREMTNWDTPADASPHYYGDNFQNCETSNFDYIKRIRELSGKVIFEFWELPPWAKVRDADGKLTQAPELDAYVRAMVAYCRVSQEKAGAPPEIVGIQNEIEQTPETWRRMALVLRQGLDAAGFTATKIHMHNPPTSKGGITAAKAFHEDPAVWKTIDYAASNLYDYQSNFHEPDGYDTQLAQLRAVTGDKPFLAVELCVNNGNFQSPSYRVAFAMGQLYHKLLTQLNVCGVMYCWTLLNVVQPSYGWTRTLFVPDPEHGFQPVPSSHQLRIFGAYSRRIKAGMQRVAANSTNPDILASAFQGPAGKRTLVLLNRSVIEQKITIHWPGAVFSQMETSDAQHENAVTAWNGATEVSVSPGAIVTLTNVEPGKIPENFESA
jgi:O-glycosyl hydrolase